MEQNKTPRKSFNFPDADARKEKLNSLLAKIPNGINKILMWGDDGGKGRTLSYDQIERIAELSYNKDAFDTFLKEATDKEKSDFCHELLLLSAATRKSNAVSVARRMQTQISCGLFEWFEPCKDLVYRSGLKRPKTDEKSEKFPLLIEEELNDPAIQDNLSGMRFIIEAVQNLAYTNYMSLAHRGIEKSDTAEDVISDAFLRHTVSALAGYDKSAEVLTKPMNLIIIHSNKLYTPIVKALKKSKREIGFGQTGDDEISPLDNLSSRETDPSVAAEQKESQEKLDVPKLIKKLDLRERKIIEQRFYSVDGGKTFKELGDELGITRERVRQIEKKALEKLREAALRKGFTLE